MKTISIINLKGGVGKTVSAISIAYILSSKYQKRVLLIDNDKQGNSSKFFYRHRYDRQSMADILTDKNVCATNVICKTAYKGLDIIPANMELLTADKMVLMDASRPQQTRLKNALSPIADQYDYCIIDNAPDINMSVINALVMTDHVMIPVKVDRFSFDGLDQILDQIDDIQAFNPKIQLAGCFVTMYQRNKNNNRGCEDLQNKAGYKMFDTMIRKSTKVDETTFEQIPITKYAPRCTSAKDYEQLVAEYLDAYDK